MEATRLIRLNGLEIIEQRFSSLKSLKEQNDKDVMTLKDWPKERHRHRAFIIVYFILALLAVVALVGSIYMANDGQVLTGILAPFFGLATLLHVLDYHSDLERIKVATRNINKMSQSFYQWTQPLCQAVIKHNNAVDVVRQTLHLYEASSEKAVEHQQFYNLIDRVVNGLEENYPVLIRAVERFEALVKMPNDIVSRFAQVVEHDLAMTEDLNLLFAKDLNQLTMKIDMDISVPELSEVLECRKLLSVRDNTDTQFELSVAKL